MPKIQDFDLLENAITFVDSKFEWFILFSAECTQFDCNHNSTS